MAVKRFFILVVLVFFTVTVFVSASPMGANITSNSSVPGKNVFPNGVSNASGTFLIEKYLSEGNTTVYWAGVYGNVTGSITLQTSSGAVFTSWSFGNNVTFSGLPALVLASNASSIPLFDKISSSRNGTNLDNLTGVDSSLVDSANKTFDGTSNPVVIGNASVNGVPGMAACTTWYNVTDGSGQASSKQSACGTFDFETVAFNDTTNSLIFGTPIRPWNAQSGGAGAVRGFDNASNIGYQMLLFVNNSGNSNPATYSFYVELR